MPTFAIVPSEILHLILLYYTHEFSGLIRFSSVCKEWKEIVSYSPLWLSNNHCFYSPTQYFLLLETVSLGYQAERQKRRVGDRDPVRLKISCNEPIVFQARKYKVQIEREFQQRSVSNGGRAPHRTVQLERSDNTKVVPILSAQGNCSLINDIKNEVLPIFRGYQRLWRWYCRWIPIFQPLLSKTRYFVSSHFLKYAMMLSFACKVIASTAFFLALYLNSASPSNIPKVLIGVGFISLYLNCLLYLHFIVSGMIVKIIKAVINTSHLDRIDYPIKAVCLLSAFGLLVLGIGGSLILLQVKLYYPNSLTYLELTIPLWICFPLSLILLLIQCSIYSGLAFSGLLIPSGFTSLAVCYDSNSYHHNVALALMPFFILNYFAFTTLAVWVTQFLTTIWSWPTQEEITELIEYRSKLTHQGLRATSGMILFAIALYANIQIIQESYSLMEGIAYGIVWILFLEFLSVIEYIIWRRDAVDADDLFFL